MTPQRLSVSDPALQPSNPRSSPEMSAFQDEIPRLRELDEVAWSRVVAHFSRRLARFFLSKGFTSEETGDLVQDSFVAAFRSIQKLALDGSLERWLFGIARNKALHQFRHRARRMKPIVEGANPDHASAAASNKDVDTCIDVERACARLSPSERRVIALQLGGLSHAEAAQVVGSTEAAMKMAFHRAKGKLRLLLGGET